MIAVETLMSTGVVSVRDSDTVREAERAMHVAGVRHLPVADAGHHVVGVVSDRDLKAVGPRSKDKRVGEVMTREVLTVRPDEPAADAAQLMLERKLGSLPVVDAQQTLIGIITETDFLRVAQEALSKDRPRRLNHGAGPELA